MTPTRQRRRHHEQRRDHAGHERSEGHGPRPLAHRAGLARRGLAMLHHAGDNALGPYELEQRQHGHAQKDQQHAGPGQDEHRQPRAQHPTASAP